MALAAALSVPAAAQVQKVGWSLGYYCGWDQAGFPPDQVDWKAFTHVSHFTVFPADDGSLDLHLGLTDANCKAAVAEAHKNGVKIVFSIGGAGVAGHFKNATAPDILPKFVKNLLDFMRNYGYDGIDTDWEEDFDDAKMVAFHKMLRDSLNKITPRPLLTLAGAGYFAANCAIVHSYVDQFNLMSYGTSASGMPNQMNQLTSKGVPKTKLGVGIGIGTSGGMVDADSNLAKAKVQFAITNGYGGIMQWAVRGTARHVEVFKMLEQYRPAITTAIWNGNARHIINDPELLIARNTITGRNEVRLSLSSAMQPEAVDLSLFAVDGRLVSHLYRGKPEVGLRAFPLESAGALPAGTYVVRLEAGTTVKSARAVIAP
ncbi:MAG: chiB1 [Fibrobacteres bacterium]|nr:chiB1 [Fibrobacterota bacterium]